MTDTPARTTGNNVRAEMVRRGLRQADIGEAIGKSQGSVSLRLRGVVPFDITELYIIADLLGVSVDVLTRAERPTAEAAS